MTTNDGTGSVNFPLTFPGGVTTAPVTVTETQQPGYTLVTQSGQNAVCTNLNTSQPVPVTNSGALGFTVDRAEHRRGVVHRLQPRAAQPHASVVVNKRWVINGQTFDRGRAADRLPRQPDADRTRRCARHASGVGGRRPGYAIGDATTIDETVELEPAASACWTARG